MDSGRDAAGGALCPAEGAPVFQPGGGAFAEGLQPGMDTVEPLVVVREFTVSVVKEYGWWRRRPGRRGQPGPGLPGQAGLAAVSPGWGQVMCTAGQRAGEPQRGPVRTGDDLHIHPVPLMFLAVVRLVRSDPAGRDQCPVNDDEAALTQTRQNLTEARGPRGQDLGRPRRRSARQWTRTP